MNLSAQDLVRTLNELFGRFDRLAEVSLFCPSSRENVLLCFV